MADEGIMTQGELVKAIQVVCGEKLTAINARFEALKQVIYNYLEAGSSMALAGVKAQLKSV